MSLPPPPPHVDILTDMDARRQAGGDFGGSVSRIPRAVLRPQSLPGLLSCVEYVRRQGIPWTLRGQGHSLAGQSQVDDGLVVDTSRLSRVTVHDEQALAEPGATWRQVLDVTLPAGLTPPVLPDYLDLSVAGTLSVGGIGGTSHRHGFLTDNVVSLDVLPPAGAPTECDRRRHPALFDAVRAGHGTAGVISRAALRLVPAAPRARRFKLYYPGPSALSDAQRRAVAQRGFDHVQGQAVADESGQWRYFLEGAVFHHGEPPGVAEVAPGTDHGDIEVEDLSFLDFADRLRPAEALLRELGEWQRPHPWCNLFVPDSHADQLFEECMATLRVDDLGAYGTLLMYPFFTRHCRTPRLSLPDGEIAFLLALLRTAGDLRHAQHLLTANDVLADHIIAAGGTVYLPWR